MSHSPKPSEEQMKLSKDILAWAWQVDQSYPLPEHLEYVAGFLSAEFQRGKEQAFKEMREQVVSPKGKPE